MRFLPTIDASNPETYTAITSGRLKLQTGQWIRFNSYQAKPSRFVGILPNSKIIWAIHTEGALRPIDCKVSMKRFQGLCLTYSTDRKTS